MKNAECKRVIVVYKCVDVELKEGINARGAEKKTGQVPWSDVVIGLGGGKGEFCGRCDL